VIAYAVAQRTREIGIRVALGAGAGDVTRNVLAQGMRLALAGVVLGLAAAVPASRFLESLLFGVGRMDSVTFLTVPGLLVLSALLACYLPARRAARVDPVEALRTE
jgi:ABC-type lipoprotein release transport system permease subunit